MMVWFIGYVLFVAYAAGLFMYTVTRDRPWAAVGILLSVSGFQLTVLNTIDMVFSLGLVIPGLILIGRDLATTLQPRVAKVLVVGHRNRRAEHLS